MLSAQIHIDHSMDRYFFSINMHAALRAAADLSSSTEAVAVPRWQRIILHVGKNSLGHGDKLLDTERYGLGVCICGREMRIK